MAEELSRVESYQYPAAHLGHLSEIQQKRLDEFRVLCEKAGYYKPAGVDGLKDASHDDETLLRYLRARKFLPSEALRQFKDTEDWRRENHLDELYETIDIQEYEETRRLYPQWTGRRDKRGIPVYLFKVSHLDSKRVSAYEKSIALAKTVPHDEKKVPTKMLRLFALYENLLRFALPLCSAVPNRPNPGTPISQSNNIVDISGVGLKQFWNLKNHMQDASTLATAHYPETLDRIFIIGAPAFFPTVWGWVKRWFDPITVSKIFILSSSNMKSTLEEYIDTANIPKQYGGGLDFEFGNMPNLESAIQNALNWTNPAEQNGAKTFPTGPIRWDYKDGSMTAIAVGTEGGKKRNKTLASMSAIPPEIRREHEPTHNESFGAPLGQSQTTSGTYTQPAGEGDLYYGSELKQDEASGTSTPTTVSKSNSNSTSSPDLLSVSRTGTSTKEKPFSSPEGEQKPYVETAKEAVEQVVEKMESVVGLGGEKETKSEGEKEELAEDVKEVGDANVEEFLRSKYNTSSAETAKA